VLQNPFQLYNYSFEFCSAPQNFNNERNSLSCFGLHTFTFVPLKF
jgi:hypothetical protein